MSLEEGNDQIKSKKYWVLGDGHVHEFPLFGDHAEELNKHAKMDKFKNHVVPDKDPDEQYVKTVKSGNAVRAGVILKDRLAYIQGKKGSPAWNHAVKQLKKDEHHVDRVRIDHPEMHVFDSFSQGKHVEVSARHFFGGKKRGTSLAAQFHESGINEIHLSGSSSGGLSHRHDHETRTVHYYGDKKKAQDHVKKLDVDTVVHDGKKHSKHSFLSESLEFESPHDKLKSDPGYMYHATSVHNAHDIASDRLVTHKPSFGTDQRTWPDGGTEKRSYFTPHAHVAHQFAPIDHGKSVLLRTKKTNKFKKEVGDDHYVTHNIHPKDLEILGKGDVWHPLHKLTENKEYGPNDIAWITHGGDLHPVGNSLSHKNFLNRHPGKFGLKARNPANYSHGSGQLENHEAFEKGHVRVIRHPMGTKGGTVPSFALSVEGRPSKESIAHVKRHYGEKPFDDVRWDHGYKTGILSKSEFMSATDPHHIHPSKGKSTVAQFHEASNFHAAAWIHKDGTHHPFDPKKTHRLYLRKNHKKFNVPYYASQNDGVDAGHTRVQHRANELFIEGDPTSSSIRTIQKHYGDKKFDTAVWAHKKESRSLSKAEFMSATDPEHVRPKSSKSITAQFHESNEAEHKYWVFHDGNHFRVPEGEHHVEQVFNHELKKYFPRGKRDPAHVVANGALETGRAVRVSHMGGSAYLHGEKEGKAWKHAVNLIKKHHDHDTNWVVTEPTHTKSEKDTQVVSYDKFLKGHHPSRSVISQFHESSSFHTAAWIHKNGEKHDFNPKETTHGEYVRSKHKEFGIKKSQGQYDAMDAGHLRINKLGRTLNVEGHPTESGIKHVQKHYSDGNFHDVLWSAPGTYGKRLNKAEFMASSKPEHVVRKLSAVARFHESEEHQHTCAWCKKGFSHDTKQTQPLSHGPSHGICKDCLPKLQSQIDAARKKRSLAPKTIGESFEKFHGHLTKALSSDPSHQHEFVSPKTGYAKDGPEMSMHSGHGWDAHLTKEGKDVVFRGVSASKHSNTRGGHIVKSVVDAAKKAGIKKIKVEVANRPFWDHMYKKHPGIFSDLKESERKVKNINESINSFLNNPLARKLLTRSELMSYASRGEAIETREKDKSLEITNPSEHLNSIPLSNGGTGDNPSPESRETTTGQMGTKAYKTAVGVVIRDRRDVLLGRSLSSDDRHGLWCFPGGGIDPEDGGDPLLAASREVLEESLVEAIPNGHIIDHPDHPGVAFVILEYIIGDPAPTVEFSDFVWAPIKEIDSFEGSLYKNNKSVIHMIPRSNIEEALTSNSRIGGSGGSAVQGKSAVVGAVQPAPPAPNAMPGTSISAPMTMNPDDEIPPPMGAQPMGGGEEGEEGQPGPGMAQAQPKIALLMFPNMTDAERANTFLNGLGIINTELDGCKVRVGIMNQEEMSLLIRSAGAFGLELSGVNVPV